MEPLRKFHGTDALAMQYLLRKPSGHGWPMYSKDKTVSTPSLLAKLLDPKGDVEPEVAKIPEGYVPMLERLRSLPLDTSGPTVADIMNYLSREQPASVVRN